MITNCMLTLVIGYVRVIREGGLCGHVGSDMYCCTLCWMAWNLVLSHNAYDETRMNGMTKCY